MSITKRQFLSTGLMVAASLGLAMGVVAEPDDPPTAKPRSTRPESANRERFLLLADGRLIQGLVTEDESTYSVTKERLGVIRLPKKKVERAFDTILDAYRFRVERLPQDDPDERIKLARWCLNLRMDAEAKEQLQKVLEISPDHGPAKAMLTKIAQSEATAATRDDSKIDVDVRKTGAEEVVEDQPGALDSSVLRGAEQRMGIRGLPVIFDLPTPMAIRRAEEFKNYVHPVLQACCAQCHNASYNGKFQLVPVANARQRTPDALRANLDATLRLVDSENLSRSELLSSALRPHNVGGKNRPILSGSNSKYYQILATWVNSLKAPAAEAGTRSVAPRAGEPGEAFAADRAHPGISSLENIAPGLDASEPRGSSMIAPPTAQPSGGRAYRYIKGQGMVPEDPAQADPQEFPLPPMLGGPVPNSARPTAQTGPRPQTGVTGKASGIPAPRKFDATRPPADDATQRAGAEVSAPAKSADDPDSKKKPKKPLKLDPNILQKLLQGNANRTPAS